LGVVFSVTRKTRKDYSLDFIINRFFTNRTSISM